MTERKRHDLLHGVEHDLRGRQSARLVAVFSHSLPPCSWTHLSICTAALVQNRSRVGQGLPVHMGVMADSIASCSATVRIGGGGGGRDPQPPYSLVLLFFFLLSPPPKRPAVR